jgi:osmoprotectant transport system permease protein
MWTHLKIVAICMAVATVAGCGLGVVAARSEPFASVSLAVTSTLLTVPSFAMFGLLSIWLGLGDAPVEVGLILYALLPVLRNTRTGITSVDPAVVEAAEGMGMGRGQVLLRVELPLALPVILAGIRQATVMIIAIATVGAAVGSNDLGQPIFEAIRANSNTYEKLLSGVLPVAGIGIVADLLLGGIQRSLLRGRTAGALA